MTSPASTLLTSPSAADGAVEGPRPPRLLRLWNVAVAAHRRAVDGTPESAQLSAVADRWLIRDGLATPFAVGLPDQWTRYE